MNGDVTTASDGVSTSQVVDVEPSSTAKLEPVEYRAFCFP